jgi:hypothetical protein
MIVYVYIHKFRGVVEAGEVASDFSIDLQPCQSWYPICRNVRLNVFRLNAKSIDHVPNFRRQIEESKASTSAQSDGVLLNLM